MQIQLKQVEIEAAIKQFIAFQGFDVGAHDASVVFTAGRKENGLTAEITIGDVTEILVPSQMFEQGVEVSLDDAPEILESSEIVGVVAQSTEASNSPVVKGSLFG